MDYLHLLGKGILQGITEFLPISSSGHLVLYTYFFPEAIPLAASEEIFIDILLHLGSLGAIILVFRHTLQKIFRSFFRLSSWKTEEAFLWKAVLISSVPTAVIGLFLGKKVLPLVRFPFWVGLFLVLNGFILWFSKHTVSSEHKLDFFRAFLIGVVQGIAALPGISRSGSTISCALWLSLDRKQAGEFSFLISIPAIIGATLLKFQDIQPTAIQWGPAMLGMIAAFFSGWLCLKGLLKFLQQGKLFFFSFYCWLLGGGALLWSFFAVS